MISNATVEHNIDEISPSNGCEPRALVSNLTIEHLRDLERSGISTEIAIEAGLYSASEREVQLLLGRKEPAGPGLVIPYPDPVEGGILKCQAGRNGTLADYVRVRLDDPERALDRDGKPSKYLSRSGSGQQPYIAPVVTKAITAGEKTIFLTEGEKKALCASANHFPTIGLSGNYGWKIKDKQQLLPLLEQLIPEGATVVVVWDSDAALNISFAVSTRMLHDILRRRGCAVKVVVLAQTTTRKVGLDDFIVAEGKESFRQIVDMAAVLPGDRQVSVAELIVGWSESLAPALQALNEEEVTTLLRKDFSKGLIDHIEHGARREILGRLQKHTSVDVALLFRDSVREFLAEQYGETAGTESNSALAGQVATVPGEKPRRVKIISVEDTFAWVAEQRKDAPSFPVPIGFLQEISDDEADAKSPAQLADQLIQEKYLTDRILTLRYFRDAFYRWNNGAYSEVPETDIRSEAMGYLRKTSQPQALPSVQTAVVGNLKAAGVCHLASTVEPPVFVAEDGALLPKPSTISFVNGNLDVDELRRAGDDTQIWTSPTPRLFTLAGRSYGFDESAVCPKWLSLVKEALPDPALQELLQEIFGYCQLPDTTCQRFFLFHGPGANGKGVVSDVLTAVVGAGNVCAIPLARFGERFALWPLASCLVNLVAEMPGVEHGQGLRIAEDKLKAIVSGDQIEIERKNRDIIRARASARLIFSCNELPPVADRSQGVWRRLIIVPFHTVVAPERQNPNLAQEMIGEELPGIFNWALEGLLRLRQRGRFIEPEICQEIKAQHRLACAPEEEFLREHISLGKPDDFIVTDEIYAAYRNFATANGNHPIGSRRFTEALRRYYPSVVEDRRVLPERGRKRGFIGVTYHPEGNVEGGVV